jgi:uncharacterized protein
MKSSAEKVYKFPPFRVLPLAFILFFYETSCARSEYMPDPEAKLPKFDVQASPPSCGNWRDNMPEKRPEEAYRIYISARKLWRSKEAWLFSKEENKRILHDVKLAAESGDWGAKALLAKFYLVGLGLTSTNHVLDPDPEKSIAIVRTAMAAGQAWGFYDLGVAYERGYGGVEANQEVAWALYLRAAQLGSPDALMALADAYGRVRKLNEESLMLQCAYKQGHGPAAYQMAIIAKLRGRALEAVRFYQDGVKYGDSRSAAALSSLFRRSGAIGEKREMLNAVGGSEDDERARRYSEISDALNSNRDLRLGRLDQVLPLPPADLPEWRSIEDALTPEPEGPPSY